MMVVTTVWKCQQSGCVMRLAPGFYKNIESSKIILCAPTQLSTETFSVTCLLTLITCCTLTEKASVYIVSPRCQNEENV